MPSLFDFGKKRRTTRRSVKSRKPPAKLLKMCKKYRVKTTTKRGGKRCYRATAMLKRLCLKKARALKKKLMKGAKRSSRMGQSAFGKRTKAQMEFGKRQNNPMEFGMNHVMPDDNRFGMPDDNRFGMPDDNRFGMPDDNRFGMYFGKGQNNPMEFGSSCTYENQMGFGKRRKVNKVAAMKAFKSFYRRHCAPRGSRFGFGSGGNPPLWQSMGYEFCSDGGGVLGANSTGLFPTPCMPPPRAAPRPSVAAKPKAVEAKKLASALKGTSPKTKAAVNKLVKKDRAKSKTVGGAARKGGKAVAGAARSGAKAVAGAARSGAKAVAGAVRRRRATAFGFW